MCSVCVWFAHIYIHVCMYVECSVILNVENGPRTSMDDVAMGMLVGDQSLDVFGLDDTSILAKSLGTKPAR